MLCGWWGDHDCILVVSSTGDVKVSTARSSDDPCTESNIGSNTAARSVLCGCAKRGPAACRSSRIAVHTLFFFTGAIRLSRLPHLKRARRYQTAPSVSRQLDQYDTPVCLIPETVERSQAGLGLWLSSAMTPYLIQEFQGGQTEDVDFNTRFWSTDDCILFNGAM